MEGGLLSLKWNNHRSSFIHVLSSLRKKDSFCDVTLACDGKFYPSHKLVLSTCSEYFQEMFQHTQCKHPVIVLKDIRCEDLEALLNYMYLGEVNVVQEKLSTLIKAAECLKIKGLAVPDDPPRESHSEKRGSSHHDSAPENKRRRTDTDHHKYKESSRSYLRHSKQSSDLHYKQSEPSSEGFHSFDEQSGSNEVAPDSYSYDNENSKKGRESNFIKQEPPDTYETVDSKVGILQDTNPTFLSPLPQEDVSNSEGMSASEPQEHWGSESQTDDNFVPIERQEGSESANEDCSQSENVSLDDFPAKYESVGTENDNSPSEFYSSSSDHLETSMTAPDRSTSYAPSDAAAQRPTFPCHMCSYVGFQKSNLVKHLVIHSGQKPYACPYCPFRSAQKGNVKTHLKRKHISLPVTRL